MGNAVIFIETRLLSNLKEKQLEFMKWLPDWDHIAVCSWKNERLLTGHKIIKEINSIYDYNILLTSLDFWEMFIQYDRVLICHPDSGILRNGIEEFLEWEYVGASWLFQNYGGNGGFSLRCPKKMLNICKRWEYNPSQGNEDIFFSNIMHYQGGKLAPQEVCDQFAVENKFVLGSLGYHFGRDCILTDSQRHQIMNQYDRKM